MDITRFIHQLPDVYQNWEIPSMSPNSSAEQVPHPSQFNKILEKAELPTNPNFLALLNLAVDCLNNGEIYCQLGCLGKVSLIGALLNHFNQMAYAVDNCDNLKNAEIYLDDLTQNLVDFNLENQVFFCAQDFADFFLELRQNEIEDKIGLLCYDSHPLYREVMNSLLLAKSWLSDQALIIIHNCHEEQVQKALQDFVLSHAHCRILLHWQISNHAILGLKNICILAWDINHNQYESISQSLLHSNKKVFLNVGCGPKNPENIPDIFKTDEWQEIRLDINPAVCPDIIDSITHLSSVSDESVDAIYSSHNLEHLYHHEVPIALTQLKRVIKPGGFAFITLPNIQRVAEYVAQGKLEETLYVSPAGSIAAIDVFYGLGTAIAGGNIYMAHKTAFTADSLKQKMEEAGFNNVEVKQEWLNLRAIGYC